uniref:Uncharacterized protein n=1 Tax=Lactuca sativa TaxID=4236 RepID=A0A9R1X1K1_LACSA|nr:hypothetical protein LSAT_V11C700375090 [Lactuca sativa]
MINASSGGTIMMQDSEDTWRLLEQLCNTPKFGKSFFEECTKAWRRKKGLGGARRDCRSGIEKSFQTNWRGPDLRLLPQIHVFFGLESPKVSALDSASPSSGLGEYLEDEEELDEWDEQLVESDEVRHQLGELEEQLDERSSSSVDWRVAARGLSAELSSSGEFPSSRNGSKATMPTRLASSISFGLRSDVGGKVPVSFGLRSDVGDKVPVSFGLRSDVGDKVPVSFGLRSDVGGKDPISPDFGLMQWARPSMCFICYCVVCGRLGELTKLRAYGFSFGFRYSVFKRGAREDCIAHTIVS